MPAVQRPRFRREGALCTGVSERGRPVQLRSSGAMRQGPGLATLSIVIATTSASRSHSAPAGGRYRQDKGLLQKLAHRAPCRQPGRRSGCTLNMRAGEHSARGQRRQGIADGLAWRAMFTGQAGIETAGPVEVRHPFPDVENVKSDNGLVSKSVHTDGLPDKRRLSPLRSTTGSANLTSIREIQACRPSSVICRNSEGAQDSDDIRGRELGRPAARIPSSAGQGAEAVSGAMLAALSAHTQNR